MRRRYEPLIEELRLDLRYIPNLLDEIDRNPFTFDGAANTDPLGDAAGTNAKCSGEFNTRHPGLTQGCRDVKRRGVLEFPAKPPIPKRLLSSCASAIRRRVELGHGQRVLLAGLWAGLRDNRRRPSRRAARSSRAGLLFWSPAVHR